MKDPFLKTDLNFLRNCIRLKLLKSNFEARSLSLYIRSLLKFNFSEEYLSMHLVRIGSPLWSGNLL